MSYSTYGADVLAARHMAGRAPMTVVGWIPPTIIMDRMRAIDAEAKELDGRVRAHVARQVFRDAWTAWYARWRDLFEKYRPDSEWWGSIAKMGSAFYTEQLAAQVEGYRIDLERFRLGYQLERDHNGQPVPPLVTPPTVPTPEPPPEQPSKPWWMPNIPWWGWVIGFAVVGGVVYSVYRTSKDVAAKKRAIETGVLPKLIGPDLAKAAAASGDPPGPGLVQLNAGPVVSTEDTGMVTHDDVVDEEV